jgi:PAS domain S-box-containing protein
MNKQMLGGLSKMNTKYKENDIKIYMDIFTRLAWMLILSLLISMIISNTIWSGDRDVVHRLLESLSIFMGGAIFLIIWNNQDDENTINNILGFGFLMFTLLDIMHVYYYKYFLVYNFVKIDSSIKYWLAARLIQVVSLLIFAYKPYIKNGSRYIMLIKALAITCCIFYIFELQPYCIPDFYTVAGLTPIKIELEYLTIIIAAFALYKLKNYLRDENLIKFKYLYLSILLIIPSEICFTLFTNSGSFWFIFGHVINIFSSIYFYRSVFQSLINYPYEKLSKRNKQLSDILNAIPIAILTYNDEDKVNFVNNEFLELSKYPREKIIGLNSLEILKLSHKTGNKFEDTIYSKVKSSNVDIKNIVRTYFDSTGQQVKVLINAHKIEGGTLVLANDARQEQEIKNLNLQAQIILNAIAVPTMIIDYMGNIVACNKQFAELLEIDMEDIVGMSIYKLNSIACIESESTFDNINFKNEEHDFFIKTPTGNNKHIKVTSSVILNIYNEIIGKISVVHDLTKIKEEQLKLVNQEKLALLGQMGATIVHETRNFLATIKGNSQLIDLYTKDEKLKSYARKINNDTNEVNRIISDFLSLSKPRETELVEVAFNDLILSMKSTIETSSLMSKIQVNFNLDYEERYMLCDETQIKQVVLNICKNAAEAMENTLKPLLSITTGLDEQSKEVFIKISDNGKGIDNEHIKKIGTPFFTTKKTGTGLGLNACYEIMKIHKGRIDIESKLGKGTTFTIIIPYIDEELEDII